MQRQEAFDEFLASKDVSILIENAVDLPEEAFAESRFNTFGASDSSKLLGVNPFENASIEDLMNEKVNEISDPTISKKPTVRMGKELEDFIINRFNDKTSAEVFKPRHTYGKLQFGLATNFDGVALLKIVGHNTYIPFEVKTLSYFGRKHYNLKNSLDVDALEDGANFMEHLPAVMAAEVPFDFETTKSQLQRNILWRAKNIGIPPYYYTQVQQQIDFLDAPFGILLVHDVQEWTLRAFLVDRDDEVIYALHSVGQFQYVKLQLLKHGTQVEDENDI